MAGRKPKPTALKVFEGNPGCRKLNADEPKPEAATPDPPAVLTPEARVEWDRLAGEMAAIGMLTRLDRGALATYCQAFARWEEAERQIVTTGGAIVNINGVPSPNPWVKISRDAVVEMMKIGPELGLTMSSRSRLKTVTSKPKDDLEDFINSA